MDGPILITDLNKDLLEECRDAFAAFDKNGDGSITTKELSAVMRAMGQNPTNEQLFDIMKECDVDGNGTIEFEEYVAYMLNRHNDHESREEHIRDAFQLFDRDGNGSISPAELKGALERLGESHSRQEVDAMIKEADLDGDGNVSYEEFKKLMSFR